VFEYNATEVMFTCLLIASKAEEQHVYDVRDFLYLQRKHREAIDQAMDTHLARIEIRPENVINVSLYLRFFRRKKLLAKK
jgi:hypothetical protein